MTLKEVFKMSIAWTPVTPWQKRSHGIDASGSIVSNYQPASAQAQALQTN